MTAAVPLTRRAAARPVNGTNAFDVILSGIRERTGLPVDASQWAIPERVPVTVHRGDAAHDVGSGRVFFDRKGNPRVRGMWSNTPLGEYVKALVAQGAVTYADLELEASIDNAGARVYNVLRVVFTLPSEPPTMEPTGPSDDARLAADVAAELLGLAARIYATPAGDVAGLADRIIACGVALGGQHG